MAPRLVEEVVAGLMETTVPGALVVVTTMQEPLCVKVPPLLITPVPEPQTVVMEAVRITTGPGRLMPQMIGR